MVPIRTPCVKIMIIHSPGYYGSKYIYKSCECSDPPQAPCNVVAGFCFVWEQPCVLALFVFRADVRTNGRTDTICETNDHLLPGPGGSTISYPFSGLPFLFEAIVMSLSHSSLSINIGNSHFSFLVQFPVEGDRIFHVLAIIRAVEEAGKNMYFSEPPGAMRYFLFSRCSVNISDG